MPNITSINGIAEDNISHHNGGTASLYTSKNGDTWAHYSWTTATGGDSIATDGDYKVHTLTSSRNFEVTNARTAASEAWQVIAGGGA